MKVYKALKDFPFAPDGINVETFRKDTARMVPDDIADGLVEAKLVEEAGEIDPGSVVKPAPPPPQDDRKVVVRPASVPQDNDDHAFRRRTEEAAVNLQAQGRPADPVSAARAAGDTTVQEATLDRTETVAVQTALTGEAPEPAGTPEQPAADFIPQGEVAAVEVVNLEEGTVAAQDEAHTSIQPRRVGTRK